MIHKDLHLQLLILGALEDHYDENLDSIDIGNIVIFGSLFPADKLIPDPGFDTWNNIRYFLRRYAVEGCVTKYNSNRYKITFKGRWYKHVLENNIND
jgi:hypothetical protein